MGMPVNQALELDAAIVALLQRAGISEPIEEIVALRAGGNNRTYRVETSGTRYAVKHYFQHRRDPRNRLQAEYAFLTYAVQAGITAVPRPLAQDADSGMALYEYIDGYPLQPDEIGKAEVDAAIRLFLALNQPEARQGAETLPSASEGAFSLQEHLENTERRIGQLQQIVPVDEVDREGGRFIQQMATFWKGYRSRFLEEAKQLEWRLDQPLAAEQRCISPSDFGFHNAIRTPEGRLRFIDFEYAGWDDPAKMITDFFSQPAVPVPMDYYDDFESSVLTLFGAPETLKLRTQLLQPAYQIKWCCITLNIFLPVHLERRRFANPQLDPIALKKDQLLKARTIFQTIKETGYGLH